MAFMEFPGSGLVPGKYKLTVQQPISDIAGNVMPVAVTSIFEIYNPGQDVDMDGLPDQLEPLLGLDPTKRDSNNNGIPDGQEDYDHDGLPNALEIAFGRNPASADSNGNGIPDAQEDDDLDGLFDQQEFLAGADPRNPDSDGDGWDDATEVMEGSSPADRFSRPVLRLASRSVSALNGAVQQVPAPHAFSAISPVASYVHGPPPPPPAGPLNHTQATPVVIFRNNN